MKLLKENKGSTLLTTMFFILVVALLTISLHLALISMIDKVTAAYDEQQAYVSARGIATTIAQSIDATSGAEMLEISDIDYDELKEEDVVISDALLAYLETIEDNNSRNLTDITVDGVEMGEDTITGTIQRTDNVYDDDGTATYLLSITSTYGDASETVTLSLTRETVQYSVYEGSTTESGEASGYLSGFYLDFMPYASCFTYSEDEQEGDDAILVCGSPLIYTDSDVYFGMKANFYCEGTVVLVGSTKRIDGYDVWLDDNLGNQYIDFFSKEDIYLSGVTGIQYAEIMASGDIYLYDGTEVLNYVNISCDTLYIDDNVTIGNDVTVSVKEIVFIGTDNSTVKVSETNTEIDLACSKASLLSEGAAVADMFVDTEYNANIFFSMGFPNRNIPTYVTEYLSARNIDITTMDTNTNNNYSFSGNTSSNSSDIVYKFYELKSNNTYTFDSSDFSSHSDTRPIVIYVPSGTTVTLSKITSGDTGVYFYLADGATLTNSSTTTNYFRVYNAALSESAQTAYESRMLAVFTNYGGYTSISAALLANDSTNLDKIQDDVFSILNEIYSSNAIAGIQSANNGEINGTITATILKATDVTNTSLGLEVEYEQSPDLGELNISREDWATKLVDYNSYNVGVYVE